MSAPMEKAKKKSKPMVKVDNHPGVYRRGGRYVATWRDPSGSLRKQSARTIKEAEEIRSQARADVARGEYRTQSKVTFAEYAVEWITSYTGRTKHGVGEGTRADYRRALGLNAKGEPTADGAVAFLGHKRLAEIEPRDLRNYAAHLGKLKSSRRKGQTLGRATVQLRLAPVKALLATAAEDGLIRFNPAAGLRNLIAADETVEASGPPVKALTEAELEALLSELPEAWYLFFAFLAQTGLRIGEAVETRWRDLDLGTGWVRVDRRFYLGRVGLPKGRKTRRVRLASDMTKALWELRKEASKKNLAGDDDLVFTSERGARIDQSNLMSRVLKPAAVKAGLGTWVKTPEGQRAESWVGFHSFRHTAATTLFRSGWNANQVQKQLGHSDPAFTLKRYVHLLDDDLPEPSFTLAGATTPAEKDEQSVELRAVEA